MKFRLGKVAKCGKSMMNEFASGPSIFSVQYVIHTRKIDKRMKLYLLLLSLLYYKRLNCSRIVSFFEHNYCVFIDRVWRCVQNAILQHHFALNCCCLRNHTIIDLYSDASNRPFASFPLNNTTLSFCIFFQNFFFVQQKSNDSPLWFNI
jgi:hypothetical protein